MIDTHHISPEDLSLYAMHLLDPAESSLIEAHLSACVECRLAVAEARADLAVLALTAELTAPRASARQRFLESVASEKHRLEPHSPPPAPIQLDEPAPSAPRPHAVPPAVDAPRPAPAPPTFGAPVAEIRSTRKPNAVLPWLGWAIAAGVSVLAVTQYRQRAELSNLVARQSAQLQVVTTHLATFSADAVRARELMDTLTSPDAVRVTLTTTPAAKPLPQGRLSYEPEKGTLVFIAANLQPVAPGKVYELWIIPADGTAPVAAGTFSPDARGSASIVMPAIPKQVAAKAFGVTLEAEGGASTPTMPILLAGAV